MAADRRQLAFLVSRVLLAPIFISAGLGHVLQPAKIAARLDAAALGHLATVFAPSVLLVVISGVALLAGGLALLVGYQTRLAAAGLALVLIPITITVQIGNPSGWGPFFKNVALFGALAQFALIGARSWSVDALLSRRPTMGRMAAIGASALLVASLAIPALASDVSKSDDSKKPRRVAFLLQAPRPLKNVLATAQELRADGAEVTVMACGQSVRSLVTGGDNEAIAHQAREDGIRIAACGLTLNELSIEAETLTRGVEVVPNGLLEMLRLQELGYRTVDL